MFFIELNELFLDLSLFLFQSQGFFQGVLSQIFNQLSPLAASGLLLCDNLSSLESLINKLDRWVVGFV